MLEDNKTEANKIAANKIETDIAKGKVTWLRDSSGGLVLHLKEPNKTSWQKYNTSTYKAPDDAYMTKGFPTFQKVLKLGWEVVPVKKEF